MESCVIGTEWISYNKSIVWKVVLKLRNAYRIWRSSYGKCVRVTEWISYMEIMVW